MEGYHNKRPQEHRKRSHYNRKGAEKQAFGSMEEAQRYIGKMHLIGYIPYLCHQCNYYHVGRRCK